MWSSYVEGYTVDMRFCPFCGDAISTLKADGSGQCESDGCDARFYVIEVEE